MACHRMVNKCFHNSYEGENMPSCCKNHMIQVLHYLGELLERENITYWLNFGSLLGAVRDGKIIPWDSDSDIGMFKEDLIKLLDLKPEIKKAGYVLSDYEPNLWQVRYSHANWAYCDIWLYEKAPVSKHPVKDIVRTTMELAMPLDEKIDSDETILKCMVPWFQVNHTTNFPLWYVNEPTKIDMEGRMMCCPKFPKTVTKFIYGPDWKTPQKKSPNVWLGNYYPLSTWLEFIKQ